MLKVCCQNQLKWRYALADSWFSSSENMKYIHATLEKQFIFGLLCVLTVLAGDFAMLVFDFMLL
jgi:hypothetical protein